MSKIKTIVISVGGSLIVPEGGVDTAFIRRFSEIVVQRAGPGRRFVLVCGGGTTCRKYQRAASEIAKPSPVDLDWIGIGATRLNAQLMRSVFGKKAHPEVITDPNAPTRVSRPIVVGAGWKPGRSSDYGAVMMAERFGADTLVNLTDVDHVYDKDPRKDPSASPIKEMSWKDYGKMFGSRWTPGLNSPFDPVAARLARKLGIRVIILNGRGMANVRAALDGKRFTGTLIG